jgi:hypothetical protein
MGGGRSRPGPGRFTPRTEIRYPFFRRLGGTQGRSGWVRKISPTPDFDPRTVQPLAGRYTAYANRTHHVGTNTQHCNTEWCDTTSETDFKMNMI